MTALVSVQDMQAMSSAMAPLFSKKPQDLFALMLLAQAEGKHPAIAAQEYDIIQGRPAINSKSALARFQGAGGRVQWIERSPTSCTLYLAHPQGGELEVTWTMDRAQKAGLTGKDNWKKYPTEMLSARCVAEGVRAVYPACLNGMYTNEEVADFEPPRKVVHQEAVIQKAPNPFAQVLKEAREKFGSAEAVIERIVFIIGREITKTAELTAEEQSLVSAELLNQGEVVDGEHEIVSTETDGED